MALSFGEIYKVSDLEPTTESGLEVSLDVSKHCYDFNSKTVKFIDTFLPTANIVYTNNRGEVTTPRIPERTKDVDGFSIHLYPKDLGGSNYDCGYVAIRMGGVVYKNRSDLYIRNAVGKIVVDVPIGKLTIPISREDLEDTPNNRKVLEEIQEHLNTIKDEDTAKIVTPKFGDTVLGGKYHNDYSGEWFTYSFADTFKDSWDLRRRLNYLHTGYDHNIINGKYTIYIIPDIKSYRSWVKRLDHFLAQTYPNTQIIWKYDNQIPLVSTETLDLSDINLVHVKKLGLPKLPKEASQPEYLVFFNGYKKGSYTAESLDELVTEEYFTDDGIADGWEKSITDIALLNRRVIGLNSDHGLGNNFWIANSKKMRDQLIELGWFTPNSPEYIARVNELRDIETKQRNMQNAEYRVKNALFRMTNPSKRTVDAIGKDPNKITRIENIKSKILKENSFRARILANMADSYNSKVTREDLRKLLNTK